MFPFWWVSLPLSHWCWCMDGVTHTLVKVKFKLRKQNARRRSRGRSKISRCSCVGCVCVWRYGRYCIPFRCWYVMLWYAWFAHAYTRCDAMHEYCRRHLTENFFCFFRQMLFFGRSFGRSRTFRITLFPLYATSSSSSNSNSTAPPIQCSASTEASW